MTFPSSNQELKYDGLLDVLTGLFLLKKLCEDVKVVISKKNDAFITNNKSKMKSLRGKQIEDTINIEWWREMWSLQ